MLHAYVKRFDVTCVRENILGWEGEVNAALVNKIHMQAHHVIFRWIVPRSWSLLQPPDGPSIYLFHYKWLQLSDPLFLIVLGTAQSITLVHGCQVSWSMSPSSHHSSPAPWMWIGHQLCRIHDF
jgi:hypothetical protein